IMRDKPDGFLLLSGDDPATLPMMALGAVGIISVVANAFPPEVAQLAKLWLENNYVEASKIHGKLIRATELCFVEGNPAGVKEILHQLGICGATVRLPLAEASAQLTEAIRAELPLYPYVFAVLGMRKIPPHTPQCRCYQIWFAL